MNILLTGSGGYIGTQMAQALIAAGHKVTGLDTEYYNEGWLYGKPFKLKSFIKKDIRQVTVSDVSGFDAVIHLAELSNDPLGQNNPELTYEINHKGTVNLIDQCIKAAVPRFIYSSSCSVYGASDNVSDETSSTNPLTAYAKSKVLNERYLITRASDIFTPIIFRNATVYGPSPRIRFDLAVNNLAGLAWTTKEVKMDSDGTPWRPFVHILDVCQAFLLALTAPKEKVSGQIMNVGDTRSNYQIKEIAEIIGKVFDVSKITLNKQGADKRNYRVNFDKIARVLGFRALRNVETGVRELKEVFKSIEMSKKTFLSEQYTRLKMIDHLKSTGLLNENLLWV
ncbi:NAD-dependent dehydratase [Candidatus Gottesmanbacteria bacterium RIFCSPHIGHO2_01_FULL_46_14]|uniref:NAD-dependent dehydratase n=3 Tax=Microgenomates group TaxID=1794810 RepID=A0A1F5ZQM0_9BACT|nr:MAG: NAD-dependent dehydratase [Candidatus Curtissbacteria bacterium GW2011_GWA1_41_11]OGG14701.1 MAG: NAD-dependent dehydratase [Candidatus Gottesmanbacteria bacterium RIFCSPHIGHO2_01_FULL_46_14]OGG29958.1 MAG: NAD-dependent dehydratase [Candidatus Gottesmanbacteria bacterium RIFCSPLOWO2_01_FULL_46_21]